MKVTRTQIADVLILQPKIFCDDRGFFLETYNKKTFNKALGNQITFVQDNRSRSNRGVLRGLHYQLPPHAQSKLVQVQSGCIFDVAVDIRRSSPTFGKWVGVELNGFDKNQLFVPAGCAHGFFVLSESADVIYKVDDYYAPAFERAILWNDSSLGIRWPDTEFVPLISAKDTTAASFMAAELFP